MFAYNFEENVNYHQLGASQREMLDYKLGEKIGIKKHCCNVNYLKY